MSFRKGRAAQSTRKIADKRYLTRVIIALVGLL